MRILIIICTLFFSKIVHSQSYIIDSSYAINGIGQVKSTDSFSNNENINGSIIDKLSKISFLHNHYDPTDVYHISPGVIRIAANGLSVDSTFGILGIAQKTLLPVSGVSLFNYNIGNCIYGSAEEGIIISGQKKRYNFNAYNGFSLRLNNNGTIQNSFGTNGVFFDSTFKTFRALEIHPKTNGGFVLLSLDNATPENSNLVYALKPNGIIDSSFAENGFQTFNMFSLPLVDVFYKSISIINNSYYISFIALDSNVGTYFPKYSGFIKLQPNGFPDSTFGIYGKVILSSHTKDKFIDHIGSITNANFTTAIAQNNIVSKMTDSATSKKYICLFNTQGYLDTTFGSSGYSPFFPPQNNTSTTNIVRLNVLENGKIIVVGRVIDTATTWVLKFYIAIYNANGSIDNTFGNNGYYLLSTVFPDAVLNANILTLDSNSFYITGFKTDLTTTNYYDGFYSIIKFKSKNYIPTKISETEYKMKGYIYPNPTNGQINISLKIKTTTNGYIKIMDATGKLVKQFQKMIDNKVITLDMSDLPNGVYTIQVNTKQGLLLSERLIKQ